MPLCRKGRMKSGLSPRSHPCGECCLAHVARPLFGCRAQARGVDASTPELLSRQLQAQTRPASGWPH